MAFDINNPLFNTYGVTSNAQGPSMYSNFMQNQYQGLSDKQIGHKLGNLNKGLDIATMGYGLVSQFGGDKNPLSAGNTDNFKLKGALGGGLTGAKLGAQVGGPLGAVIGGVGGAIFGSWAGDRQQKKFDWMEGLKESTSANASIAQSAAVASNNMDASFWQGQAKAHENLYGTGAIDNFIKQNKV